MPRLNRASLIDQITEHLREGIAKGRWSGSMPGALRLSREFDVSKDSLVIALNTLEEEGLVRTNGAGKAREVVARAASGKVSGARRRLRVGILPYEDPQHSSTYKQRQLLNISREIEAAGHTPFFAPRSQMACKGDLTRIAAMVESAGADVWIVLNSLQEVPDWFRSRKIPIFTVGGRGADQLPWTAYCPTDALRDAMRQLIALGHRRIILICPRNWRLPEKGPYTLLFLSELKRANIPAGEYNIPDWTETPAGFSALLKSLFSLTPPTALIVGDARQAMAVTTFLSAHGLRVGDDVSLIVRAPDPVLEWTDPATAHFAFDEELIVRRVARWLEDFAHGRADSEATLIPMTFVNAATMGPPPKSA